MPSSWSALLAITMAADWLAARSTREISSISMSFTICTGCGMCSPPWFYVSGYAQHARSAVVLALQVALLLRANSARGAAAQAAHDLAADRQTLDLAPRGRRGERAGAAARSSTEEAAA